MIGFYELIKLAEEEGYKAAINSVNMACWGIEVANGDDGQDINYPLLDKSTGGCFETNTLLANWDHHYDH